MSNVMFARPRHNYDSYVDLYRLIELSGFPLIFIDEIDASSDNVYVLTILNGEVTGWPGARARIILYDLEYHLEGIPPIEGVSEVWAADKWYAFCINARYVPLGSHPGLNLNPDDADNAMWDGAMLAYMGPPRRQQIAHELHERGVRLAPNGWGAERHATLIRTRSMIHVHQHTHIPSVAAQRLALAAAYRLPYITERVADSGIIPSAAWFSAPYEHLAQFAAMWLNDGRDGGRFRDAGDTLYHLLCETHTFRKLIEAAL